MVLRADVVRVARTFIHTPFRHQGRIKGRALDCVGLPLCTAEELELLDRHGVRLRGSDHLNYPAQPMGMVVQKICVDRLIEKDIALIEPGDVLTIRNPDDPVHTAIVTAMGPRLAMMVHAHDSAGRTLGGFKVGRIVECNIDDAWRKRIFSAFSFPGVE